MIQLCKQFLMSCRYPAKSSHFADAQFMATIFVFFRERFHCDVFSFIFIQPEFCSPDYSDRVVVMAIMWKLKVSVVSGYRTL